MVCEIKTVYYYHYSVERTNKRFDLTSHSKNLGMFIMHEYFFNLDIQFSTFKQYREKMGAWYSWVSLLRTRSCLEIQWATRSLLSNTCKWRYLRLWNLSIFASSQCLKNYKQEFWWTLTTMSCVTSNGHSEFITDTGSNRYSLYLHTSC